MGLYEITLLKLGHKGHKVDIVIYKIYIQKINNIVNKLS